MPNLCNGLINLGRRGPAILLIGVLLFILSACGAVSQPPHSTLSAAKGTATELGNAVPSTVQGTSTGNEQLPDSDQIATAEAALGKSGKPGPTLPSGDASPQAGLPATSTSTAFEAAQATAQPAGKVNSTLQATPPTLSPEEIATREAVLANSGRGPQPGQEPSGASKGSPLCTGGIGLVIVIMLAVTVAKKKPI